MAPIEAAERDGKLKPGGRCGERAPYLVEGVGEDFWPQTFDRSVIDR